VQQGDQIPQTRHDGPSSRQRRHQAGYVRVGRFAVRIGRRRGRGSG
jgi:hypothetical protein